MLKKVPKKNIETVLVDIKKPDYNYERVPRAKAVNLARLVEAPRARFRGTKRLFAGIMFGAALAVVALVFYAALNVGRVKAVFTEGSREIATNFSDSLSALKAFEPQAASVALEKNQAELAILQGTVQESYGGVFLDVLGNIIPAFKDAGAFLGNITQLNATMLRLSNTLASLETDGMKDLEGNGGALLRKLQDTRNLIRTISGEISAVRNTTAALERIFPLFSKLNAAVGSGYLEYSTKIHEADTFLGGLLTLLGGDKEKHFLVLFANAAEIRPGGGFTGSYADITVKQGELQSIDVRDIYDPDGQLDLKVVPPEEINTVTRNWGARDANWFFDFPTSAKTALSFMERSKIYADTGTTFEGVVGLNINVFQSILAAVGPVALPDYHVTITSDNFLNEIQREVEAGADKKAGQPKRILKVLAPIILERLKTLSPDQSRALMDRIGAHFANKDIMVYMKNSDVQRFLASADLDGSVYELPNNFWGTYLAVVDANIAGGKADAFIDQSVSGRIDVDTGGSTFADLSITRTHNGAGQKDPWWRAYDSNFTWVYTTPGSSLVSLDGASARKVFSNFDYDGNGYVRLPALDAIEKTKVYLPAYKAWVMRAFGKTVFGTRFDVAAGQSATLHVRYQTPNLLSENPVLLGNTYTFFYERQSGVTTKLSLTFSAPLGFVWKESGSPIYTYENDNPPARVVLPLTLTKSD